MEKAVELNPRSCKDDVFPSWAQPCPLGYFSVNSDRWYAIGHSNLRYYKEPRAEKFPLDLNAGLKTENRKIANPLDEDIEYLLRFIVDNCLSLIANLGKRFGEQPTARQQNPLLPVEFVCCRELLRLIMSTPFEYREDWIIRVTRYKGVFYLSQGETDEAMCARLDETEMQRKISSWGYNFKQYCLTKTPKENPKLNIAVEECSEFSCVFLTTLVQKHNVLFAAEMDGIKCDRPVHLEPDLPLDDLEFVELKTCLESRSERQLHSFFCDNARNWWCQAFLVGINKIVVGWRDENGLINGIEEVQVSQLPKKAKNWNPNKCGWFLVAFLDCLKSLMSKVDCPYTVWEFKNEALNSYLTYRIFEGCTEKSFLPGYYVELIEMLSKRTGRDDDDYRY